VSLKESIERELHVPTSIRWGKPGSLDVFADGQKIYSKKPADSLPSSEEVLNLLRNRKPT